MEILSSVQNTLICMHTYTGTFTYKKTHLKDNRNLVLLQGGEKFVNSQLINGL